MSEEAREGLIQQTGKGGRFQHSAGGQDCCPCHWQELQPEAEGKEATGVWGLMESVPTRGSKCRSVFNLSEMLLKVLLSTLLPCHLSNTMSATITEKDQDRGQDFESSHCCSP